MEGKDQERTRRRCPDCGSDRILRIEYGLLSPEGEEAVKRGEFYPGGCCLSPDSPAWHCTECGHEWGFSPDPLWP